MIGEMGKGLVLGIVLIIAIIFLLIPWIGLQNEYREYGWFQKSLMTICPIIIWEIARAVIF